MGKTRSLSSLRLSVAGAEGRYDGLESAEYTLNNVVERQTRILTLWGPAPPLAVLVVSALLFDFSEYETIGVMALSWVVYILVVVHLLRALNAHKGELLRRMVEALDVAEEVGLRAQEKEERLVQHLENNPGDRQAREILREYGGPGVLVDPDPAEVWRMTADKSQCVRVVNGEERPKVRYDDMATAYREARRLNDLLLIEYAPYVCYTCGGIHVGRSTRRRPTP